MYALSTLERLIEELKLQVLLPLESNGALGVGSQSALCARPLGAAGAKRARTEGALAAC